MEEISLTGATLLSDFPGRTSVGSGGQLELVSSSSSNTAPGSGSTSNRHNNNDSHYHNSHHGHDHDHSHSHSHNNSNSNACSRHANNSYMMTMHPLVQALPGNISDLVQRGTLAELLEALATFVRLSRRFDERNNWLHDVIQELHQRNLLVTILQQLTPPAAANTAAASTSPDPNHNSNNASGGGHSILHWAAKRSDDVRYLKEFLQHIPPAQRSTVVNIISQDAVGMTPLHWACTEGNLKHVQALLQHGANVDTTDISGCTPLLIAAQYGHVDLVAMLLKRGANGTALDKSRDSALHWAAYKGSLPVCGVLTYMVPRLSYTQPDTFGQTPLHLAALRGHTSVVRYILENLMDVDDNNSTDNNNNNTSDASSYVHRRRHVHLQNKIKEDLLWLRDQQGRTPLELAIHKQRPTVAALLQHEMDQMKLSQQLHSSSTTLLRKLWLLLASNMKIICSIHNWKVWMGCRSTVALDEIDESPKFPFYLVVGVFVVHMLLYPFVFTPLFKMDQGVLWDLGTWHAINWLVMIVMWYCFYKISHTSPGYIGGGRAVFGTTTGAGNNSNNNNSNLLTQKWRRRYEQVLDAYAHDDLDEDVSRTNNEETTTEQLSAQRAKIQALKATQLCHTCHIARPTRSKHCRVARRCVLMFDHHCPFVGNTVGLYNYQWFYLTLVLMTLAELGFLITLGIYLVRTTRAHNATPWKIVWIGIGVGLWIIPAFGMAIYHTQLSMVNLTTNEHQNMHRYQYLHDPTTGRFYNPWFHGWRRNFLSRFVPSEANYLLPRELSGEEESFGGSGGGGSSGSVHDVEMGRFVVEEHRSLLLTNRPAIIQV